MRRSFVRIAGLVFFTLLLSEALLRIAGLHPGGYKKDLRVVKPYQYIIPDSLLGWRLNSGSYITYIQGKPVSIHTVDNFGNRITSNKDSFSRAMDARQKIFVFGCSYTFGYTVSDSNTYPYYLQTMLQQYSVVNKAVPGYSLIQMYLSLKREVDQGNIPAIAIFNYATFHDARNALARQWLWAFQAEVTKSKIDIVKTARYPFGKLTGKDSLRIAYCEGKDWYTEHPLIDRSALLTLFNLLFNSYYDRTKQDDYKEISFLTGCKIMEYCKEHHIQLLFTGMDNDSPKMLHRWQEKNANTLFFNVNVLENGNNNGVLDPIHPGPATHRIYANEVWKYMVNKKIVQSSW